MTDHDPDHYKVGGIETIEYMRAKSTPEEFAAYCKLSVEKYRSRAGKKDGATELQDARKALKFCEWWVEALEGGAVEGVALHVTPPRGWSIKRLEDGAWDVFGPDGLFVKCLATRGEAVAASWEMFEESKQGNTK